MPPVPLQLPKGSSAGRYGMDGAARLLNAYAEEIGEGGKTGWANYCISGLSRFATSTAQGGVRVMLAVSDNEALVVIGHSLYRMDTSGSLTLLGGVRSDGFCQIARNRANPYQAVVVADGGVWSIENGAFADLSDPDLPPPNGVTQVSGYFVFTLPDGRWFISDVDSISVDGLDYTAAQSNPDPLLLPFARGPDLLLFGTRSMEAWQDQGQSFPFGKTTSIEVGCLSQSSVATVDQTVGWIAHDGTVRLLDGYQAKKISGHDIDRLIEKDSAPSLIRGFSWTERGHTFYALRGTNWTKVYDLKTDAWHDRASLGRKVWRCGSSMQFGTRRIFGDADHPRLYELDHDLDTEDGDVIQWVTDTAPMHAFPDHVAIDRINIDIVTGTGSGQGATQDINPKLVLKWSDDGGRNFGVERHLEIGAQGQTQTKVRAFRLGRTPQIGRTWRFECTANVAKALMSVQIVARKLA